MQTVQEIGPRLGVAPSCDALGLSRATYYRGQTPRPEPQLRTIPRALSAVERGAVLEVCAPPLPTLSKGCEPISEFAGVSVPAVAAAPSRQLAAPAFVVAPLSQSGLHTT